MRAVAGSESPRDLPPDELDRHLDMLSRLAGGTHANPTVTLILRAANSGPAKALIALKDELAGVGVSAKAILAKLAPEEDLRQLFASLSMLAPHTPATELLRFARNPRLHDAHEQTAYGETMCWSGDAMRRDTERRNVLTQFHEDADRARLARLAFTALWTASSPVPARHLRGDVTPLPLGEYQRPHAPPVVVSPLLPSPQGWPLIRH